MCTVCRDKIRFSDCTSSKGHTVFFYEPCTQSFFVMSACVFFKRQLLLGLNLEKFAFRMGSEFKVLQHNPVVESSEYAYKVRRQANDS